MLFIHFHIWYLHVAYFYTCRLNHSPVSLKTTPINSKIYLIIFSTNSFEFIMIYKVLHSGVISMIQYSMKKKNLRLFFRILKVNNNTSFYRSVVISAGSNALIIFFFIYIRFRPFLKQTNHQNHPCTKKGLCSCFLSA